MPVNTKSKLVGRRGIRKSNFSMSPMRSFSRRENPLKRSIEERIRRGQAKTITMKEVKVKAISRTNKARVTNCHRRKKSVTTMWIHYLYQVPHWGNWEFLLEIHFLNTFWELSKWYAIVEVTLFCNLQLSVTGCSGCFLSCLLRRAPLVMHPLP